MDLFIRIDSFLIDQVFQRISDRLAPLTSCYGIAAFLLTGALPMNFLSGWMMNFWLSVIVAVLWMPFLIIRAYKLESSSLSNVQPTERIEHFSTRIFLFVLQVMFTPADVMFLVHAHYWSFLGAMSWWLIIIALYFMACRRNPPKPKVVYVDATA